MTALLDDAISLSRLILRFGQTMRITEDAHGRQESDTTHTLMLALMAGEFASHEAVPLDQHAVVMLSLIHDIAEAYAGDTATLWLLDDAAKASKAAREAAALERVKADLCAFPWVLGWIDRYEAQACLESRFVKYLDKVLPKLTHRDNGCAVPIRDGMSLDAFKARHRQQQAELAAKYPEFTFCAELLEAACRDSEARYGILEACPGLPVGEADMQPESGG